jgi:prepilin-type N-terminal cleavage/methylation domain-containing protein
MKMTKTKLAKGFTLVELLVVIAIIAALAALSTPVVLKQQKKAAATEAVNNAKQMFILLFEFDQDRGQYPGAAAVNPSGAISTSSNEVFREFFLASQVDSEDLFYCRDGLAVPPDGDIATATTSPVENGSCGFRYLWNGTTGFSTTSNSGIPLIITPADALAPTVASPFAINPFGGKAVILFNDGSVRTNSIVPTAAGAPTGNVGGTATTNPMLSTYPANGGVTPVALPAT